MTLPEFAKGEGRDFPGGCHSEQTSPIWSWAMLEHIAS